MKLFKIFLASPGDTSAERNAAEEAVDEINKSIGSRDNFRLELLKWENDTYPSMGADGQDVINKQIGGDYKIFVGIMWKKFGTPTKRAGSGTEEEFKLAYDRFTKKKDIQIMFYFNSCPIPQDADLVQFQKVREFKKKLEELGAYHKPFDSTKDFEKSLRMDLTRYVKDIIKEEIQEAVISKPEDQRQVIPEIKESFKIYLNDLEANFAHSKVDHLRLEDIYIAPDLKDLNNSKKTTSVKVENLDALTDAIDVEGTKFAFLGNDSAGKSANCKYLFQKSFELGLYPVLIKGSDVGSNIRPETLQNLIEERISEQYEDPFNLTEIDNTGLIIIVDDFHKATKGKNKYWPALMKKLEELFHHIIVTGNSLMLIENLNKQDTKPKTSIPSLVYVGLLALVAMAFFIPAAIDRVASKSEAAQEKQAANGPVGAEAARATGVPPGGFDASAFIPVVAHVPSSAPAYDALRVVTTVPRVIGGFCRGAGNDCTCFTQQATVAFRGLACREWIDDPPFEPYQLPTGCRGFCCGSRCGSALPFSRVD